MFSLDNIVFFATNPRATFLSDPDFIMVWLTILQAICIMPPHFKERDVRNKEKLKVFFAIVMKYKT